MFPIKCIKLCRDDKPWVTGNIKKLDRARKREYFRNKASEKLVKLDADFKEQCDFKEYDKSQAEIYTDHHAKISNS